LACPVQEASRDGSPSDEAATPIPPESMFMRSEPHQPRQNLDGMVRGNVEALLRVKRTLDAKRTLNERIAAGITAFAGTMYFAYLHALVFGTWILINSGAIPFVRVFDPFPFVMLAMFASVEAIFLSTFVLISQNRAVLLSEKRAELDLQVNLIAERELTELLHLVDAIAKRMGIPVHAERIEPLKQTVTAENVLEQIDHATEASKDGP
jgi:uncharacterized membrane protein